MKNKKIVFLISTLNAGGAERVITILANSFADKKYEVSLITFQSHNDNPFYFLNDKVNLLNLDLLTKENSNVFSRIYQIFRRIIKLRKVLKNIDPQMVISFMDSTNISMILATMGLSLKKIVSERIDPTFHITSSFLKGVRYLAYAWASKIIVQTHSAAFYFNKLKFFTPIYIIPNPVLATIREESNHIPGKKVDKILCVGRLDIQKDHKTLIKAFSNYLPYNKDVQLFIFGKGPQRPSLEKLINELKIEKNVFLKDPIKNISSFYESADLFIFPSLYEGFPNALCEALSYGIPTIASNCSGNTDIIKDKVNGRLFNAGNCEELYTLLMELSTDYNQRCRLSKESLKIIDEYRIEKIISMWENIFT